MSNFASKVKEEIVKLIPPTVFFFVALHLIALIRSLMLQGAGIPLATSASITIAALVLGKSVLIADALPMINRYPGKPLAYNVAWKTAIYFLVAMVIHYLEHLYEFSKEAGGLVAGNRKLLSEIIWPHFWGIQIVILMIIFMYCTIRELVREVGRDKAWELFFGSPSRVRASS